MDEATLELVVTGPGRWLAIALAGVLGGVLGSFINVVAYRLPRGLSLIHPGSSCPSCGHPIRWHDNLPVLGWLLLRGKCRDCHAPISARYPLVELIAALIGGLIAWSQAVQPRPDVAGLELEYVVSIPTFVYYLTLAMTLLTAALIEFDGARPSLAMLSTTLAIGLVGGAIWPQARGSLALDGQSGVAFGAAGLGVAALLSALAWPAWIRIDSGNDLTRGLTTAAETCLVGVYLGVPGACLVATAFILLPDEKSAITPRYYWGATALAITLAILVNPAVLPWTFWRVSELDLLCISGLWVAILAVFRRAILPRLLVWVSRDI